MIVTKEYPHTIAITYTGKDILLSCNIRRTSSEVIELCSLYTSGFRTASKEVKNEFINAFKQWIENKKHSTKTFVTYIPINTDYIPYNTWIDFLRKLGFKEEYIGINKRSTNHLHFFYWVGSEFNGIGEINEYNGYSINGEFNGIITSGCCMMQSKWKDEYSPKLMRWCDGPRQINGALHIELHDKFHLYLEDNPYFGIDDEDEEDE